MTAASKTLPYGFATVFGKGLVEELDNFVHRPFVVATMPDLREKFRPLLDSGHCRPYLVRSMDESVLEGDLPALRGAQAFVGLGGGQALDAAKYFAWRLNRPLFQVPTALSVNAAFGQRAGLRIAGHVRYVGWAVPEAVYIDYDVIRAAPRRLNHSGIGDILCFHTGVLDWKYASDNGTGEEKWPYDEDLAARSLAKVDAVLDHREDIRELTDKGVAVLVDGLQWGTTFHGAGWMPRHIEGIDHFVFYALEASTGVKFLHGQPVCLGVVVGSLMHDARADEMLDAIRDIGLDIRPEAMGLTWAQTSEALLGLGDFVRKAGLWHGIAHDVPITRSFVSDLRRRIEHAFGPWTG